jgi:hypothetical protein
MRAARFLLLTLILLPLLGLASAPCAQARKTAPKPETAQAQPKGESVELSGRLAVGLDKTFIKDKSKGYFVVQGLDLSRFAGRHIEAKGVVVGQEQEVRVVRLLEYRIKSPDDDSPGAAATGGQGRSDPPGAAQRKKK